MSKELVPEVRPDVESVLESALAVSLDGFAIHRVRRDDQGRLEGFTLEMINRAGAAGFTDDPRSLVGRDVAELLGPSSAPMLAAFRRAAETGQVQRVRTTFTETPAAGTTDSIVVRIDEDHVLSTWRDITDQIVAETLLQDALRQANEAWRTLRVTLDAMDDAVVLLEVPDATRLGVSERAGRVRFAYANATAAAALGLTSEQLTGMRLDQVVGATWAQELGSLIVRARLEGQACTHRVGVPPDGEEVQDARELTATPVDDHRVLLVSRDITRETWDHP